MAWLVSFVDATQERDFPRGEYARELFQTLTFGLYQWLGSGLIHMYRDEQPAFSGLVQWLVKPPVPTQRIRMFLRLLTKDSNVPRNLGSGTPEQRICCAIAASGNLSLLAQPDLEAMMLREKAEREIVLRAAIDADQVDMVQELLLLYGPPSVTFPSQDHLVQALNVSDAMATCVFSKGRLDGCGIQELARDQVFRYFVNDGERDAAPFQRLFRLTRVKANNLFFPMHPYFASSEETTEWMEWLRGLERSSKA